MTDGMVTMTHAGADEVFYLDAAPLAALAGRWAIRVDLSFFRALGGPTLQSITLI